MESSAPGPGRTANRCEAQIPRRPLSQTPCTPAHASAPSEAARGPGDAAPAFPPRPWPRTPCDRLRSSALPKPPSAGSPNEPEARNPTTSSAAHCPQPLSIIRQRERLSFLRHFSSEPLVSGHVPGRPVVPRGGPPPPPAPSVLHLSVLNVWICAFWPGSHLPPWLRRQCVWVGPSSCLWPPPLPSLGASPQLPTWHGRWPF